MLTRIVFLWQSMPLLLGSSPILMDWSELRSNISPATASALAGEYSREGIESDKFSSFDAEREQFLGRDFFAWENLGNREGRHFFGFEEEAIGRFANNIKIHVGK